MHLNNNDHIVSVLDDCNNLIYEFDIKRLYKYWEPGDSYDYEWYSAEVYDCNPEYLFVIMTTASDQGGIVAVIDMAQDTLVHYHNGAYAIKAFKYENYVITVYGVYHWGVKYHNFVDAIEWSSMQNTNGDKGIELGDVVEFTHENRISVKINDGEIYISDELGQHTIVNFKDLIG